MDPFATLGLPRRYDIDSSELERAYRQLQRTLHPDKHVGAPASQRKATLGKAVEVNEAYRTLRDELSRAQALLTLLSGGTSASEPADPELLMEIMELREALNDAKHQADLPAVRGLAQRVDALRVTTRDELARVFDQLGSARSAAALTTAGVLVSRLKYYQRFLDEVSVIEEEALA